MDGNIGKFLGKYQIVEPLGEGGMATVYKAYDAALERYVAVKIIRSINQVDPNFLARFQREAKALAKLDHPYILKVLDYGEENGIPYLVMPYVARGTLKQVARSRIGYRKAIELLIPIGEALSYAHRQKIIHRDIKPANILFGESGEPVLSDFGIAKMIDAGDETQLTSAGVGVGTPDYMAPEQWNGVADERTDVYALGIVLYELVTGRCPYHADTPAAILLKQVQDPLPRP
jgi:serine/threonine protein kinase